MRTTIDSGGRVVIPKAVRESLDLRPGTEVDVVERDGRVEIEPATTSKRLVETDSGPVAVSDESLPMLSDEVVRATIERARR